MNPLSLSFIINDNKDKVALFHFYESFTPEKQITNIDKLQRYIVLWRNLIDHCLILSDIWCF